MKRFIRHTTRLGNWLWYASVSLLVLLAVILTLFRALLPMLDEHRLAVEERISEYVGRPVEIATLDARLLGHHPSIILNDVSLLEERGGRPIIQLESLRISLDVMESLWQGEPVLHELAVVGAHLMVIRDETGHFQLQGMALPAPEAAAPQSDAAMHSTALSKWLLGQGRLAIERAHITWHDKKQNRRIEIDGVELALQSRGERHRMSGQVVLPDEYGKSLQLELDFNGRAEAPESWQGNFYLGLAGVQPRSWLAGYEYQNTSVAGGTVNLELWGQWQALQLQRLAGAFAFDTLAVSQQGGKRPLGSASGRFAWQRMGDGWLLDADRLVHRLGDRQWQPSRVHLQQTGAGRMRLQASYADIETLAPLLHAYPQLEQKQRDWLSGAVPRGIIRDLYFERTADRALSLQAQVEQAGVNAWEAIPGIEGLSGELLWHRGGGRFKAASRGVALDLPRLFREPLPLERVAGEVAIAHDESGWSLQGHDIALENSDINLNLQLAVSRKKGQAPYLDLKGTFHDGDARSVPRYLPARIMSPATVDWLDQAFKAGRVVQGEVVFLGEPRNFPFDKGNGLFRVDFQAEAMELAYQPDWPHLTSMRAHAVFEGLGMMIEARQATLLHSEVGQTTVSIENFRQAQLDVQGAAKLTGADMHHLLTATPLAKLGGGAVADMQIEGSSTLQLSLRIPLAQKLRARGPAVLARGVVGFDNSRLLLPVGVAIHGLNGELVFENSHFSAREIQGRMLGEPVTITVASEEGDGGETLLRASGGVQLQRLQQEWPLPFVEHLAGATPVELELTIPHGNQKRAVQLSLNAPMHGVAVDLPSPFGKKADDTRELRVDTWLSGAQKGQVAIDYGPAIRSLLVFSTDGRMELEEGGVHFGTRRPSPAGHRVMRFTGSLKQLDLSAWSSVLPQEGQGGNPIPIEVAMERLHILPVKDGPGSEQRFENLRPLDIVVNQLSYNEVDLGNVRFRARSKNGSWEVDKFSLKARGVDLQGEGIWRSGQDGGRSSMTLNLDSPDIAKMMKTFGYASVINKGKTTAKGQFHWRGTPADFDMSRLNGRSTLHIEEGAITEVDPGAGKLFGLFSLQALPRRLALDFSDISGKGIKFSEIKGDITIKNGDAFTENLTMKSSVADTLVTGRTGLAKRDYDHIVNVVPHVGGTVSVASGLAFGPQVAAIMLLVQNIFKDEVNEVTLIQYQVTGSWDKPVIKRLEKETTEPAEGG